MLKLKRVLFPLFVAVITVQSTHAAEPMDGVTFDAYTNGKTLFYGQNGQAYGAEMYLDDRRVKWSFLDGECKDGYWYEDSGQICFVYDGNPTPQCWAFSTEDGKLSAQFENIPGATQLYEAEDIGEEMICIAPNLGV